MKKSLSIGSLKKTNHQFNLDIIHGSNTNKYKTLLDDGKEKVAKTLFDHTGRSRQFSIENSDLPIISKDDLKAKPK